MSKKIIRCLLFSLSVAHLNPCHAVEQTNGSQYIYKRNLVNNQGLIECDQVEPSFHQDTLAGSDTENQEKLTHRFWPTPYQLTTAVAILAALYATPDAFTILGLIVGAVAVGKGCEFLMSYEKRIALKMQKMEQLEMYMDKNKYLLEDFISETLQELSLNYSSLAISKAEILKKGIEAALKEASSLVSQGGTKLEEMKKTAFEKGTRVIYEELNSANDRRVAGSAEEIERNEAI